MNANCVGLEFTQTGVFICIFIVNKMHTTKGSGRRMCGIYRSTSKYKTTLDVSATAQVSNKLSVLYGDQLSCHTSYVDHALFSASAVSLKVLRI
uniref:Uncharacterized protein n=1 Tax=Lutzomyia longipalpis TaxID=7200 RepID=A0A1B0CHI1_LUTLO